MEAAYKKSYVEDVPVVKMPVSEYKKLATTYFQSDLKKVMDTSLDEPSDKEVNFCLQGQYIYLFYTSGKGIDYDINIMEKALQTI